MTKFRGCIDIHSGQVKQIVGGTLDSKSLDLETNFVSTRPSSYYSSLYLSHGVEGCHVIKLGGGDLNDQVALELLQAWRGHLQIGGGINDTNAKYWIDQGASHVIITSWLFPNGVFDRDRLDRVSRLVGLSKLVVDLSCRRRVVDGEVEWIVAMNKWQTLTDSRLSKDFLQDLSQYCDEFLIHLADVEGLCNGIDEQLVTKLGEWSTGKPITYAGGAKSVQDLDLVNQLSGGKVDLTYGSALDIFGGKLVTFEEVCNWNATH